MTIQQLSCFIEAAYVQNFTKAAERLFVSQSTLSSSILSLERELDAALFFRNNGRSVTLTPFGEKLLPYAKNVLGGMDDISRLAAEEHDPLSGVVSIAYSYINGYELIPETFRDFTHEPQNESIVLNFDVTHNTRPTEERIISGEIDLAFNCTTGVEGVSTFPFAKQQLYVFVPAEHPLAGRASLSIPDIKDEPFINYHPASGLRQQILRMFSSRGLKWNEAQLYDDWASQMASISLGFGIGISPILPVDSKLIRIIPLDDPLAVRTVYMLWATERKLPAAVKHVRQYCMDQSKRWLTL